MRNNVIKLPDNENMNHHHFCPKCHYWLFGENRGDQYCPHCGIKLFWNSKNLEEFHSQMYDYSISRYKQLVEHKEACYAK